MLWQSGVVNYVYATAWIFLYLWLYLRDLDQNLSPKKFGQSKAVQGRLSRRDPIYEQDADVFGCRPGAETTWPR